MLFNVESDIQLLKANDTVIPAKVGIQPFLGH